MTTIFQSDLATLGATLEQHKDGIEGTDLGVIGDAQYMISDMLQVYRRPASHIGTYGGWRWECSDIHPAQYSSLPIMREMLHRIRFVRKMDWAVSDAANKRGLTA